MPVKVFTEFVDEVRTLARSSTNADSEELPDNLRAEAIAASETWVALAIIAYAYVHGDKEASRIAIFYLACGGLADNPFWIRAQNLMSPILANCINNASETWAFKQRRPTPTELDSKLFAHTEVAIVDMFSMLLYCLGGATLLHSKSVRAKLAMAELLFGA